MSNRDTWFSQLNIMDDICPLNMWNHWIVPKQRWWNQVKQLSKPPSTFTFRQMASIYALIPSRWPVYKYVNTQESYQVNIILFMYPTKEDLTFLLPNLRDLANRSFPITFLSSWYLRESQEAEDNSTTTQTLLTLWSLVFPFYKIVVSIYQFVEEILNWIFL